MVPSVPRRDGIPEVGVKRRGGSTFRTVGLFDSAAIVIDEIAGPSRI
jgi:hypothetical protein